MILLMRRTSKHSLAAMRAPSAVLELACEWSRDIPDAEFLCIPGDESRDAAWPEEWA